MLPESAGLGQVPLLDSKISQPQAARLIARPRLSVLPQAGESLVLLTAPAGAGKTSALLDALAASPPRPCYWYTLDASDNQPRQFCAYLLRSLSHRLPLSNALTELLAEQPLPTEAFGQLLLHQLQQQQQPPSLLILDDWHCIEQPELQQLLQQLLQHLPAWLQLIVTSRRLPDWPWLASWRLRGRLRDLQFPDLAFTETEAEQLFAERLPGQLLAWQIQALNRQLEGWALGLQALTLQSAITRLPELPHQHLSDYLLQELFRQQPAELQQFLLQSCLAERFTVALLQQAGCINAQAGLTEALHRQLFLLPLDSQHQWFRYHQLFAQTLSRQWQQQAPQEWSDQHARWARAWSQAGHPAEAVRHALHASDPALLVELLLESGWLLQRQGYLSLLEDCCQRLGDGVLASHPKLGLLYAWHLFLNRREHQQARQLLEQIRHQYPDSNQQNWRLALLNLECHLAFDLCESQQVERLIEQELRPQELPDLTHSPDSQQYLGLYSVLGEYEFNRGNAILALDYYQKELQLQQHHWRSTRLWCEHQLGMIQLQRGFCDQAAQVWQQALNLDSNPLRQHFASWCVHLGLAELHFGRGHWQQAEQCCRDALEHCGDQTEHPWRLAPYSFLARLHRIGGRLEPMQAHWQHARQLAGRQSHHPLTLARLDSLQLDFWRQDSKALHAWLHQHPLEPDWPFAVRQVVARNRAKAWYLLMDPDRLLAELLPIAEQAQRAQLYREWGRDLSWLILAGLQTEHPQTELWLAELLPNAEFWGLIGDLIEQKDYWQPLLHRIEPSRLPAAAQQAYRQLLDHWKPRVASRRAEVPEPIQRLGLTAQEWQILRRIGAHHSNEQIADALCISLATVKSHINKLYRKLKLTNREQAALKASELNAQNPS